MAKKSKAQIEQEQKARKASNKAASRARKSALPDPEVELDIDLEVPAYQLLVWFAGHLNLTISKLVGKLIDQAPRHLNPTSSRTAGVEWIEWVRTPEMGEVLEGEDRVPQTTPQPTYVTRDVPTRRLQITLPESQRKVLNAYRRYSMGAVIELILLDRCRPIRQDEITLMNLVADQAEFIEDEELARSFAQTSMLVVEFEGSAVPSGFHVSNHPLDYKDDKYSRRITRRSGRKGYVDPVEASIHNAINNTNARAANPNPAVLARVLRARENHSVLVETSESGSENTYATMRSAPRWGGGVIPSGASWV